MRWEDGTFHGTHNAKKEGEIDSCQSTCSFEHIDARNTFGH